MKRTCINVPLAQRQPSTAPLEQSQICGQVTYLQIGERRVKCIRHDGAHGRPIVTHFASGICIINEGTMLQARVACGTNRVKELEKAAVQILIDRYGLEVFYKNLDAAPVINQPTKRA